MVDNGQVAHDAEVAVAVIAVTGVSRRAGPVVLTLVPTLASTTP